MSNKFEVICIKIHIFLPRFVDQYVGGMYSANVSAFSRKRTRVVYLEVDLVYAHCCNTCSPASTSLILFSYNVHNVTVQCACVFDIDMPDLKGNSHASEVLIVCV